jgi:hypothetical protein
MKKSSTWFLRIVIVGMALLVAVFCIFAIPPISKSILVEFPFVTYPWPLIMIGAQATALPFFFGLYQGLKLLHYIDTDQAFSGRSIQALSRIKYAGFVMTALYAPGMPLFYQMAQSTDAPGLMMIGLIINAAPFVVAVFAAVLQMLVKTAVDIKNENELTV